MWDSGVGMCVACHKVADRDILGRCEDCFKKNVSVMYGSAVERGTENPYDKKGSTAHVRDIKRRRLDTKTGKMFYAEAPKTYFFPKGK